MKKIIFTLVSVVICMIATSCTTPAETIAKSVELLNKGCPLKIDETTMLSQFTIEGQTIVCNIVTDEDAAGAFVFQDGLDNSIIKELKEEMIITFKLDPEMCEFMKLCKDAKYNIQYRYIGSITGKSQSVTIFYYEL